ncbi:hypothetical protein GGQ99_000969 [Aminobacter niigataensis]|uniref:Uncharacterized protein n=1 Tax=Aminobacter niigataensis TaxID=83265 RepID=A0ABR6KXK7_9HYPH|nr:hypothetical protein [Aminobacter niigataensis]MBB4649247.1 hypothetical protein [Aminobacter niigataensis]
MSASPSMLSALKWLRSRHGDGVFEKNHSVLVAGGERAPVMRSTWSKLAEAGLVEFYLNRRRVRVTSDGLKIDLSKVSEAA